MAGRGRREKGRQAMKRHRRRGRGERDERVWEEVLPTREVQHVHKIMREDREIGEQILVHPYSCAQEIGLSRWHVGFGVWVRPMRQFHAVFYVLVTERRLSEEGAGWTMIQKCDAWRQWWLSVSIGSFMLLNPG
jgi:hypothetical protein